MSGSSLKSARLYSLLFLLVAYIGINFAWAHHQRLSLLFEARQAVLKLVIAEKESEAPPSWRVPGLGEIEVTTTSFTDRSGNTKQVRRVYVRKRGGKVWAVSFTSRGAFGREERLGTLEEIAGEAGIVPPNDRGHISLYQEIETKLLGATVTFPVTALAFQGTSVVWASAIVMLGLLVALRNRTELVLKDPELGGGEPWLIVDGRNGLEKWAARVWLAALLVAPWLVSGALVLAFTSQLIADGAATSLLKDTATMALILTLLVVNGWLGLTCVSRILQLRRARGQYTPVSEKQ